LQLLERIPPGAEKDDCQRTAVEGLGGIGKTQIALEAAFRVRDSYPDCSVFWVPAVDATSFENAYRAIGQELKLEGANDAKTDIKALVKAALDSLGSWLLIVDNADDTELLATLVDYLPLNKNGSILVTTRNHEVTVSLDIPDESIITIGEMGVAEATKLLRNNLKESQTQDAADTAKLLDFLAYLPLAIRQASAYMAKTRMSTAKYLDHCQSGSERTIELLSKDFQDRGRYKTVRNPVAATWLISFEQISRDSPLAATYLKFLSFMAEKDIPRFLLPAAENGPLEADEAIGTLKAYAFITEREGHDSYDMHRLVRLATQNWIGKEKLKEQISAVLSRLDEIFPSPKHENRAVWLRALPHVMTALEHQDDSTPRRLISNVGHCYRDLGKLGESEQLYRTALRHAETALGAGSPGTVVFMSDLACALDRNGKYDEAEQMFRQTLKPWLTLPEHPSTLSIMRNLASLLLKREKYEEAERLLRHTQKVQTAVLGLEHPDSLNNTYTLAGVLSMQGKFEEAEQLQRHTIKLWKATLGLEHPHTISGMSSLGGTLKRQGKYDEAEQLERQTVELWKTTLGLEHPHTLTGMNNLGITLNAQGKYGEAEQLLRQTLELRERVIGREHPNTIGCICRLVKALLGLEKLEEAEHLYRRMLERNKGHSAGSTVVDTMSGIAEAFQRQERYKEAAEIYQQVLGTWEKLLGPEHPRTQRTRRKLEECLKEAGTQGRTHG